MKAPPELRIEPAGHLFEFGPFTLYEHDRRLTRDGLPIALTPKSFDVLLLLIRNHGSLVTKSDLLRTVWPDVSVEENTLTRNIADLRKVLGKDSEGRQFIETVPKFGYRFVAPVTSPQSATVPETSAPKLPVKRGAAPAKVAVLCLAAVALYFGVRGRPSESGAVRITGASGLNLDPALSPRGDRVAYASDRGGGGRLDIWVQGTDGSKPIRLTHDPADDSQPAFSPDGKLIAFHSEREGGGLYLVGADGGAERRIADLGRDPQFSPDGRSIAYWVGDIPRGIARVYVVASGGGTPRRIDGSCGSAAGSPVWSPDGRHLLFWCKTHFDGSVVRGQDWWVAPAEGGSEVQTHASALLESQGLSPDYEVFTPSAWVGNHVVFAAASHGKPGLWSLSLTPDAWRATGRPEQLTFSDSSVRKASVARSPAGDVRLAYAAVTEGRDIWSLPVDANSGATNGTIRRLTNDPAGVDRPSTSPDGKMLAYTSYRAGSQSLWAKDLRTGAEWMLAGKTVVSQAPQVSPDGSQVAYVVLESPQKRVVLVSSLDYTRQYAPPARICENCGYLWGWLPNGKSVLFDTAYDTWDGSFSLGLLDIASRTLRRGATSSELIQPAIFRNGNWIAFCVVNKAGTRQIFISRFHAEEKTAPRISPSADWIAITPGDAVDTSPVWSPDGNLLYYLSPRDGERCIWAQRLDAATKRPLGPPFAVYHMHDPARGVKAMVEEIRVGLSLANGQLVFAQAERSGTIWMSGLSAGRL